MDFLNIGKAMGEIDRIEQHSLSRTATNKDKLQSILNRTKILRENQETFHRDIYAKLKRINTSIDTLKFAKRNAEINLDKIQQQLRTKDEEQQNLKDEIQKKEKQIEDLKKTLKTTQDENAELTNKIQKLKQDIIQLKEDARKCNVEKDELEQKLRELEKEVDKHDKEIVAIIQQLESELNTIERDSRTRPQIETLIDDILKKLNPSMDSSTRSGTTSMESMDGIYSTADYDPSRSDGFMPAFFSKRGGKPKKKRQKTKKPKNPKKKRKKTKKQKRFR
jgi:chromosome segregation ATPase